MKLYKINNITCSACKNEIENHLKKTLNVDSNVNIALKKIQIVNDDIDVVEINNQLNKIGFSLDLDDKK